MAALHELGHGLGFLSSFAQDGTKLTWGLGGLPTIADTYLTNSSDQPAIRFPSGTQNFKTAVTNNGLFWSGDLGKKAAEGSKPRVFAPNPWQEGSSSHHLGEYVYPQGDANSLMTPFLNGGERNVDPGPIARGVLQDIGWEPAPAPK